MGFVSASWQMGSQGYARLYLTHSYSFSFSKVFPLGNLGGPEKDQVLWCVGGLYSAAGGGVDTVTVECDFFVFFFGGASSG